MTKLGIILLNTGGPTSLESVRPFLQNLFNDPEIISFGPMNVLRRPLAWYIAKRRAVSVRENYAMVGGKSPLAELSAEQAAALEARLRATLDDDVEVVVRVGFSYWHPFIAQAADQMEAEGCDRIILLPLYPQFSRTTTGSCLVTWDKIARERGGNLAAAEHIDAYHTHPGYLRAVNERIDEALAQVPDDARGDVTLLFSAHGTPVKLVEQGDPYSRQVRETAAAVMDLRGHDLAHNLSFQSKVGPAEWLTPETATRTKELIADGTRHLVVVPIAFVSDHIETLHELDIKLRREAQDAGIETFRVTRGLNSSPTFIDALADLVVGHLAACATPPDVEASASARPD